MQLASWSEEALVIVDSLESIRAAVSLVPPEASNTSAESPR
jgi:hypothetical protein